MNDKRYRIFISYKHYDEKLNNNDEKIARKLYDKFRSAGFECWMDKMDMPVATKSWIDDIVTAIEHCDLVVMIISKHSQESDTIRQKELRVIADNKKLIIPFRIDRSELLSEFRWEISSSQWVDAWDDPDGKIDELISKLRLQLGDPKNPQKEKEEAENLQTKTFKVGNFLFNMVHVEGGTFMMGATEEQGDEAYPDEKPIHKVTLSDYWIAETQVTQSLWTEVMRHKYKSKRFPSNFQGEDLPVEMVSWDDCKLFIAELNEQTGEKFRLPTEAEWEFAARGGLKSKGFKYAGGNSLKSLAWFAENSEKRTHSVKLRNPNELGLYDLSGNVFEWCEDRSEKYSEEAQNNPQGAEEGFNRVARGGSWCSDAGSCRVSIRYYFTQWLPNYHVGLRLAL